MLAMISRKTGKEPFTVNGQPTGWSLLHFWHWHGSDILGNALRGKLAEYIVAQALGCADGVRMEWDACDLVTADGCRVEVKTSGYLQSWQQTRPSRITFSIRPTLAWDASRNEWPQEPTRPADVYVFALFAHQDPASADPLCLDQWRFYVIAKDTLDRLVPHQKSICLSPLKKLGPVETGFDGLGDAIRMVYATRQTKS